MQMSRMTMVHPFTASVALVQIALGVMGLALGWSQYFFPGACLASLVCIAAALVTNKARCCTCCFDTEQAYLSCSKVANGLALIASICGFIVALVFFFVWMYVANWVGHNPDFGQAIGSAETYCETLRQLNSSSLRGAAHGRARMVLLLTDGAATVGRFQDAYGIAQEARKRAISGLYPVAVHGLAFGRGADLDMLRLLSAGSGGIATRIYDDADMDTQVKLFFESVGEPLVSNVTFDYTALSNDTCGTADCATRCTLSKGDTNPGGKCSLTQQPKKILYAGSTLVQAGRLPLIGNTRAQALKVEVRGSAAVEVGRENALFVAQHIFTAAGPHVLTGDDAQDVKKIWAQMAVSEALEACPLSAQDMKPGTASLHPPPSAPPPPPPPPPSTTSSSTFAENLYGEDLDFPHDWGCALGVKGGSAGLLALARAAALDAQIVTPFTSMVVTTTDAMPTRRSASNCTDFNTTNATTGCSAPDSKANPTDTNIQSTNMQVQFVAESMEMSAGVRRLSCWVEMVVVVVAIVSILGEYWLS